MWVGVDKANYLYSYDGKSINHYVTYVCVDRRRRRITSDNLFVFLLTVAASYLQELDRISR